MRTGCGCSGVCGGGARAAAAAVAASAGRTGAGRDGHFGRLEGDNKYDTRQRPSVRTRRSWRRYAWRLVVHAWAESGSYPCRSQPYWRHGTTHGGTTMVARTPARRKASRHLRTWSGCATNTTCRTRSFPRSTLANHVAAHNYVAPASIRRRRLDVSYETRTRRPPVATGCVVPTSPLGTRHEPSTRDRRWCPVEGPPVTRRRTRPSRCRTSPSRARVAPSATGQKRVPSQPGHLGESLVTLVGTRKVDGTLDGGFVRVGGTTLLTASV